MAEHLPLPYAWFLGKGRRIGSKYGSKGFCLHELGIAESFSESLRRQYVQTLHDYHEGTKVAYPVQTDVGPLSSLWPPLAWGHEDILEANFPAITEFLPEDLIEWIRKRKVEDWERAKDNIYCLSSWYLFYWWFLSNLQGKTFTYPGVSPPVPKKMAHGNAARRHAVAYADATYWEWQRSGRFHVLTWNMAMAMATQRWRIDRSMESLAKYVTDTPPWFHTSP
jgi:hypothetical protein